MVTEMQTNRVRRTWLDKLLLCSALRDENFDGHHEVLGEGRRLKHPERLRRNDGLPSCLLKASKGSNGWSNHPDRSRRAKPTAGGQSDF